MSSETPSRTHSLAADLRDAILVGTYRPGDRLPAERELAARHSVNRASVREALKKLEQLRLVDIRRGGGARVCPLPEASLDLIHPLLHVHGELDASLALQVLDVIQIMVSGAARLAMERATEAELLEAREALRALSTAGEEVGRRLVAIDALFGLMTRASDNLVLQMIYNAMRPSITGELGRVLCGALLDARGDVAVRLAAIDEALAARDPAAAEQAVREFQRDDRQQLRRALALHGAFDGARGDGARVSEPGAGEAVASPAPKPPADRAGHDPLPEGPSRTPSRGEKP